MGGAFSDAFSDAFSAALSRFSIGPSATGWCSQGCHGIVDTGTFLLTIPGQFMSAFLQALGAEESDYGVGGKGALHTRGRCHGMRMHLGGNAELWRAPGISGAKHLP